jgi:hypothetical protein
MNTTTRRHPRTLAEAFPDERACAVDAYVQPAFDRWAGVALAVMLGISAAVLLVHWAAS